MGVTTFSIGGIRVATEFAGQTPRVLAPHSDFLCAGDGRNADLYLQVGPIGGGSLQLPGDQILFDSGGLWRLWQGRNQEQLLEVFNQASPTRGPYLSARWHPELGRGRLQVANNDYELGTYVHPLTYPLDELMWIQLLAQTGAWIQHACAVVWRGKAICFTGCSGAGKTTLTRLFQSTLSDARILSDDRVIIRQDANDEFKAWGTPWHGDAPVWSAEGVPLAAIVLLDTKGHSQANRLTPVHGTNGLTEVLVRAFPPVYHLAAMNHVMDTLVQLPTRVPIYSLDWTNDERVVDFLLRQNFRREIERAAAL